MSFSPRHRHAKIQLVTNCNQLKTGFRFTNQLVTNRHQLKIIRFCASQPVTNCNRLKISPDQRNLILPL